MNPDRQLLGPLSVSILKERAAGSSAPACCVCGCEFFVWWIREQGRYSSETPWEYYDRERHPRAVCLDCSRDVPRTHNVKAEVS